MRGLRNRYALLGLALISGGGLFVLTAWLVLEYMPLVGLGVSAVILGAVSLALGRALPRVSPDVGMLLLEAGFDNIASLVEELGLRSRAIYLPTSLTEGVPRALIPLRSNPASPTLRRQLERRFIVHFGPGPEDFGVLVATPGSSALSLREEASPLSPDRLEEALTAVLVGSLDIAVRVRVVGGGEALRVEVAGSPLSHRSHPAYTVLGSPIASIVATFAAEAWERPVTVASEEKRGQWHIIELQIKEGVVL